MPEKPTPFEFERARCYVNHRRRISCVTLLALYSAALLLASNSCFADCIEQAPPNVESDVSRPEDIGQLMRNLKQAFDGGQLLDRQFYSDINLMQFFNGTSVRWRVLSPPEVYVGDITVNPSLVGIKGIQVITWKNGAPLLDSTIRIEVGAASELTLGGVRKVFGKETWTVTPEGPSHPVGANVYIPPTPFGIEYVKTTPSDGGEI